MTLPRKALIDHSVPGLYHCSSRCVRRAFLCGFDDYSGRNFEHRREWIRKRLQQLSHSFAVEVLSYSVMSNHTHQVLRNRPDLAAQWSPEEVASRWLAIFPRHRHFDELPDDPPPEEIDALLRRPARLATLRLRLSNLSWFMRALNEFIARRANREDGCTGHFWEGRFFSQRLLDEASILACLCYVDLNPVRAALADSLLHSEFTGAYDRILARQAQNCLATVVCAEASPVPAEDSPPVESSPAVPGPPAPTAANLDLGSLAAQAVRAAWLVDLDGPQSPFSHLREADYLRLLDETGRQFPLDKPGRISPQVLPILESLGLDPEQWTDSVRNYRCLFGRFAGRAEPLRQLAAQLGRRWFKGLVAGQRLFDQPRNRSAPLPV